MDIKDENLSRRGSLAISALLNEDTTNHRKQSTADSSPVLSSGTTSPIMGASSGSQLSKAKRKRISPAQYNRLMEIFDQTDTPSSEIRENLAEELDMTKREVQVWFQNRRAKMNRTKNLQGKIHRHSLIPTTNSIPNSNHININNNIGFYQAKPTRRSSAYSILENHSNNLYKPQMSYPPPPPPQQSSNSVNGRHTIAPMPSSQKQEHNSYNKLSPLPQQRHEHHHHHSVHHSYHPYRHQRKPSAIDLLASAAEYVRSDNSKEMTFFRT